MGGNQPCPWEFLILSFRDVNAGEREAAGNTDILYTDAIKIRET